MVANPALLIVSEYRPGARLRKAKWPSVLVVSVCTKLVARFFASTIAPATLPPFSSTTSPWTVPAVICDCPHPGEASPKASVKTQNAHNSFLIFSPPDITTPIRTSQRIPQKVEAARRSECCEGVYAETVQKYKSGACGNFQCFEPSFGCNSSAYGNAPRRAGEWRSAMSATIAARGNNSRPERACRGERDALDPEVWLPPETNAMGECPIMNNFLSHDETVWVASRI